MHLYNNNNNTIVKLKSYYDVGYYIGAIKPILKNNSLYFINSKIINVISYKINKYVLFHQKGLCCVAQ